MNIQKLISVAALLTSLSATYSYAEGPYIGINLGTGIFSKTKIEYNIEGKEYSEDIVQSDMPFMFGANAGYGFSSKLRLDGSVSYTLPRKIKGDYSRDEYRMKRSVLLGMVNLYYDFHNPVSGLTPFVGLGLGYAQVKLKDMESPHKISQNGFAYGISAGLSYAINEKFSIELKYSYNVLPRITETIVDKDGTTKTKMSNYLHALTAGVRFTF